MDVVGTLNSVIGRVWPKATIHAHGRGQLVLGVPTRDRVTPERMLARAAKHKQHADANHLGALIADLGPDGIRVGPEHIAVT
jgi:hypothetical protein